MPSTHLILCRPLLLLPLIFPSIRVFSSESALYIRWPKDWSFSISPFNECSGLISFRTDWFDLLKVQGSLKSLKTSEVPGFHWKRILLSAIIFFFGRWQGGVLRYDLYLAYPPHFLFWYRKNVCAKPNVCYYNFYITIKIQTVFQKQSTQSKPTTSESIASLKPQ